MTGFISDEIYWVRFLDRLENADRMAFSVKFHRDFIRASWSVVIIVGMIIPHLYFSNLRIPTLPPLRPAVKIGIVLAGFAIALTVAVVAMGIRQELNAADPSQGMQAFGDLVMGMVVFTGLALPPLGLGLYWLRPVTRFWTILTSAAAGYALTGPLALLVSGPLRLSLGNWALLGDIRIGTMPLSALAVATCALFAPTRHLRLILLGAAFLDGALFVGVILFKLVRPAGY